MEGSSEWRTRMRINTNVTALNVNAYLAKSESNISISLERLSSGYRINRAVDDPAGKAISEKMRRQIRGLDRSSDNAKDGISVAETADGALAEVTSMIQRMRELAVQSASDTNSPEDRASIQNEIDQLTKEIDRISQDTEFNNKSLFDGSVQRRSYTNVDGVEVSNLSNSVVAGKYLVTVDTLPTKAEAAITGNVMAGTSGQIEINGESVGISATDTLEMIEAKIRDVADRSDIGYENGVFTSDYYGSAQQIDIIFSEELKDAWGVTDITGVQGTDAKVSLGSNSTDDDVINFNATAGYSADGETITITDRDGFSLELTIDPEQVTAGTEVTAEITDMGTLVIQLGANTGQTMDMIIPKVTTEAMGIDRLNVRTEQKSGEAIVALDKALSYVSSVRSQIGAQQNRLESAIASLDVTSQNMSAADSRLADVNMAEEMTEYTTQSVLQQASTTMLAQANELPERVLQLLQ